MSQEDEFDPPARPELSEKELQTVSGGFPDVYDTLVEIVEKVSNEVVEHVNHLVDSVSGSTY